MHVFFFLLITLYFIHLFMFFFFIVFGLGEVEKVRVHSDADNKVILICFILQISEIERECGQVRPLLVL